MLRTITCKRSTLDEQRKGVSAQNFVPIHFECLYEKVLKVKADAKAFSHLFLPLPFYIPPVSNWTQQTLGFSIHRK